MDALDPIRHLLLAQALLCSVVLAAQPHYPSSEQWYNFTDDGHQQYVYEMGTAAGAGDTVIVLHGGWGAEHSYLLDPFLPVAEKHRLVFYDQRGSLRSPAADSTIKLPRLVADLEDLRLALGLEKLTLAAHSMGNALAYSYLAEHPQRVRGLVLIGPVHPIRFTGNPDMEFIQEVWPEADSAAIATAASGFFENINVRAMARMRAEGLVSDSLLHVPPQELELLQVLNDREWTRAWRILFATVNSCSNDNWREMQGGMAFYEQKVPDAILNDSTYAEHSDRHWPALKEFQGPVQVLIGTCDYVDVGPMVWPHIVEALPEAGLHVVEDAGHSIWMDRPKEFVEKLAEALEAATAVDHIPAKK